MTTNDTGSTGTNPYTDEIDVDLTDPSNAVETATFDDGPFYFSFPYLVGTAYDALGFWSPAPLPGEGFDTADGVINIFGASGSPCSETSTASPVVTLTWVPAAGQDVNSDPPPQKPVAVFVQAKAEADASGDPASFSGSASADDGLGDGAVEMSSDTSSDTYKVSQGGHLLREDGSSGTIVLSGSPSATASALDALGSSGAVTGLAYTFVGVVTSPNVVAERIDATNPHSARIYYKTEPSDATVTTATFTLPAQFAGGTPPPAQTVSNVSGEFSFTFDQTLLPQSLNSSTTSDLTLNWEAQSNDPALPDPGSGTITTTATVADKNVSGSSQLGYWLTLGEEPSQGPTLVPGNGWLWLVPTQSYTSREWSEKYSYSLSIAPGSLTLHYTGAWADLQTYDEYQGLPTDIAGWSESHYLLVDGIAQPKEMMSKMTGNAIPMFTNTHWGMALSADEWFMPSQHIVGVSNCDLLAVFDDNEPAVQVTYPVRTTILVGIQ